EENIHLSMEFFGLSGICKYIRGGTLRCKVNKFYLESSSNGDYTVTESNIDRQVSSKLRTSDSSLFVSQIRITGENDIYIYNYPNSSPQNPLTLTLGFYLNLNLYLYTSHLRKKLNFILNNVFA
ncbi:hypothetical protein HMI56_003119, partial [Coelomomyces lativittatus]